VNLPAWLEDIVEHHGSRRLAGAVTRQEAVTAVRDEIAARADGALVLAIYADYAGRALDAWHRDHQNPSAPVPVSSLQGELFPDLKPRLFVQPGVSKPVMTMTAHDWDNAYAMIRNRTEGAIDSAEEDWKNFEAAYKRVRPLLDGDATTADIVRELRGEHPLEGLGLT
jgi:hypothetical protein